MNPRWERLWELFHEAVERPRVERAEFLDRACEGDETLRARLESLLQAHERPAGILDDVHDPGRAVARAGASVDPLIGQSLGRYRIIAAIGEGGMGIVYDAEQTEPVRRRVALKLIRPGMDTRDVVARFELERHALALMDHSCIARVLDAGTTEWGRPYVVMEYVEGVPITAFCDHRRLNITGRLELLLNVCDGVQHAHQKGIIHRDLKPSNVLVCLEDGRPVPKIIDFGVAKATEGRLASRSLLTSTGMWLGTPEYMSPEQAEAPGREIDTRTDVYGLGMLLYELLVGTLPFDLSTLRAGGIDEVRRRIRDEEPARPAARLRGLDAGSAAAAADRRGATPGELFRRLRGDLDWIALRALEKDPARRYASVAELAADVRRHLRDEPVLASPPGALYLLGKFARRHRAGVVTSLAGLGLLVTFAVVMAIQAGRVARERDRAAEEAERAALEARTAERVSDFLVGLFRVSDPLRGTGGEITARELLDRGARSLEGQLGDEPAVQARLLATIGRVYGNLGMPGEAADAFERALAIRREMYGERHLEVARALHHLAAVREQSGDYEEARALFEKVVELNDHLLPPGDPARSGALEGLALVLRRLGAYREAASLLEQVLAAYEATLAPDDARIGTICRDLGLTLVDAGDTGAAREALERALAIVEGTLGPDHAEVGFVLNGLSIAHWKDEDFEGARPLLERSMSILERVYTPDHPLTMSARGNLARLLQDLGEVVEARALYRDLIVRQEAQLGADHPHLAYTLANLASLLAQEGELAEADRLYRRAIRIREERLGLAHPLLADTLDGHARLLRARGDEPGAREREARAASIRQRGEGGPS